MNHHPLRIVLASDSPLWLQALHTYLDALPERTVIREVACGVDTLVVCHEEEPDVVLLDFNQSPLPIATLIATLRHFVPKTHVIGCTTTYCEEIATLIAHSHRASYLVDQDLYQSLTQILNLVMAGHVWYSRVR